MPRIMENIIWITMMGAIGIKLQDLDNFGDGAWTQYSQKITDSQYFKSNFQIRWRVVGLE